MVWLAERATSGFEPLYHGFADAWRRLRDFGVTRRFEIGRSGAGGPGRRTQHQIGGEAHALDA
jgi:hypothetical protein